MTEFPNLMVLQELCKLAFPEGTDKFVDELKKEIEAWEEWQFTSTGITFEILPSGEKHE